MPTLAARYLTNSGSSISHINLSECEVPMAPDCSQKMEETVSMVISQAHKFQIFTTDYRRRDKDGGKVRGWGLGELREAENRASNLGNRLLTCSFSSEYNCSCNPEKKLKLVHAGHRNIHIVCLRHRC